MINNVKQAIVNKLNELYPDYTIYDEDVSEHIETPSFKITLIEQYYNKKLNTRFQSSLTFDIAYFSDKRVEEIKNDCYFVQSKLLKGFDRVGPYRIMNKQAKITDQVLHFTFNVSYTETLVEDIEKMKQLEDLKTNI